MPQTLRLTITTLAALAALFALPALAEAGQWTGTKPVASKTRNLTGFSADIGDNGYAVMAYVVPGESLPGEFEGAVFVKVKRPHEKGFRPALFRGTTHTPFTDVEIGPGGMTLVTYRGENGLWRVSTRWPSGDWLATQQLDGADSIEAPRLRIGREGYAAILGLDGEDGTPRSVEVALRDPDLGVFSNWVRVSQPDQEVGRFASIAPSVIGRWTVAWSHDCEAEPDPGGVSWIDLDSRRFTDPTEIPSSGCVTRGLDLQGDRHGNQFVRLGLAGGIQLAARRHDRDFGVAYTVSAADDRTDGGYLSVSGNGEATLLWGRLRPGRGARDAYLYVTAKPGGKATSPRKIKGLRLHRRSANDVIKQVSPLPHGGLALALTRSWFTKRDLAKVRLGTGIWKPGSRIGKLTYTRSGKPGRFVNRIGMETSFRGSSMAWWSTQTELTAKPLGYWWRARF